MSDKAIFEPSVVDNGLDVVSVMLGGEELSVWYYNSEHDRRTRISAAREFCEGWFQATERARNSHHKLVEALAGYVVLGHGKCTIGKAQADIGLAALSLAKGE